MKRILTVASCCVGPEIRDPDKERMKAKFVETKDGCEIHEVINANL